MNSAGQWFWYAGATLVLVDIASLLRPAVVPDARLLVAGIGLMATGLTIAFAHGALDAWEQYSADERGEPA